MKDTEHIHHAKLQDLGFEWSHKSKWASISDAERNSDWHLEAAAPALRALRCKTLHVRDCTGLQNVSALKGLTTLTELGVISCGDLENVDDLEGLEALTNLDLSSCSKLQNVNGLRGLTALTSLDLSGCSDLQNIDGLKDLTALARLDLSWCRKLQNVDGLKGLTALTELRVSGFPNATIEELKAVLPKTKIWWMDER